MNHSSFSIRHPALYKFAISHGFGYMTVDDINTVRTLASEMSYPHPIQPWDSIEDIHIAMNTWLVTSK